PFRCRRSVGIDSPAPPKVGGNSSLLVPIMTLPGSAFAPDVKSNSGPFRDIAARGSRHEHPTRSARPFSRSPDGFHLYPDTQILVERRPVHEPLHEQPVFAFSIR